MFLSTSEDGRTIIRITASILNSYNCSLRGHFQFERNLTHAAGNEPYFDRGTYIHAMLEVYYQLKMWSDFQHDVMVREAIQYGRYIYTKLNISAEIQEKSIATFRAYCEKYAYEQLVPLGVEVPFSAVLYEDDRYTILYEGKRDLIGDLQNEIVTIDYKTSERRTAAEGKSPKPPLITNQWAGYCWGDQYGRSNTIIWRHLVLTKEPGFEEEVINYTPIRLAEWRAGVIYQVFQHIQRGGYPIPNHAQCYGGKSPCRYVRICLADPEDRERVIKTWFKEGDKPYDHFDE